MLKMKVADAKVVMLKGEKGSDISSIEKTVSDGLVDSYTITLTDGTKHTFSVTNGSSIASIKKTGSSGLTDTYTVTLTNGNTTTFDVTNGNGITGIEKTSTNALVDTYTINYSNGNHGTFSVTNGRGITSVKKTGSIGINDTYTITYNDGTTSTYDVINADAKELTDKLDSIEGITSEKFVSGTACTAGNYYIANDTLYKCIANTDGSIPVTNTAYFTETTVMSEVESRTITIDRLFDASYTPVVTRNYGGNIAISEVPVDMSKYDYLTIDDLSGNKLTFTSAIPAKVTEYGGTKLVSNSNGWTLYVQSDVENNKLAFNLLGTSLSIGSSMPFKITYSIYGVKYRKLIEKNF